MNSIVFQNGTPITPEFINELKNPSFSKEPGEVGYIPNPLRPFVFLRK